jgi:hypothetical protein
MYDEQDTSDLGLTQVGKADFLFFFYYTPCLDFRYDQRLLILPVPPAYTKGNLRDMSREGVREERPLITRERGNPLCHMVVQVVNK